MQILQFNVFFFDRFPQFNVSQRKNSCKVLYARIIISQNQQPLKKCHSKAILIYEKKKIHLLLATWSVQQINQEACDLDSLSLTHISISHESTLVDSFQIVASSYGYSPNLLPLLGSQKHLWWYFEETNLFGSQEAPAPKKLLFFI